MKTWYWIWYRFSAPGCKTGLEGLIPAERHAKVVEASVSKNYTTVLNIVFLALTALLAWRSLRSGGWARVKRMNKPAAEQG